MAGKFSPDLFWGVDTIKLRRQKIFFVFKSEKALRYGVLNDAILNPILNLMRNDQVIAEF